MLYGNKFHAYGKTIPQLMVFLVSLSFKKPITSMTFIPLLLVVIILLLLLNIFLTNKNKAVSQDQAGTQIQQSLTALAAGIRDSERQLKDEFVVNRNEQLQVLSNSRIEMNAQLVQLSKSNEEKFESVRKTLEEKLLASQLQIDHHHKSGREELRENLEVFKKDLQGALQDYKERLREQFAEFDRLQKIQHTAHAEKLTEVRSTLELSVNRMQEGNEKKLEEMRKTVDEKLNETLEKRLGESFKLVSDRLEAVHKGLGEMQTLALSVGDLKKVMTNVKSRGVLGEYQLQNIIEDLLTNEQYEKNVKTKVGSGALVEFAIKMPHGDNLQKTLWLPVDSKFPKEDYELLVDAYEHGDIAKIEEHRKAFIRGIRKNAQDIRDKYIDPPNTTEYGIMFLPYESLFGEVLRTPGLFEQLQKEFKITITGPTTLSALLNSLQMGFRTLAIEKRSGEVWDLLGAVKTEFNKFGDIVEKTKQKLISATKELDSTGVRTRAIVRKLRDVQELPQEKSNLILDTIKDMDTAEEHEDM
jgi:DNA recombination protein RmuC